MTLEDYNRNENADLQLARGEALLLVTGGRYDSNRLTLNGIELALRPLEKLGKLEAGARSLNRNFNLILPTQADIDAILDAGSDRSESEQGSDAETPAGSANMQHTLAFDLEGTDEAKRQFSDRFDAFITQLSTRASFAHRDREDGRESWYATNGGFLFLGVYFGILFMLAAALIIYYKQLSEGYDDAERFEILQKVGMSEAEVKRTINRQILAVFFLPLLVAVIHVTVAFFPISRTMIIFGVLNIPLLAATTALTTLAYVLVYLLVFRRTARTYFGIVRRKAVPGT